MTPGAKQNVRPRQLRVGIGERTIVRGQREQRRGGDARIVDVAVARGYRIQLDRIQAVASAQKRAAQSNGGR